MRKIMLLLAVLLLCWLPQETVAAETQEGAAETDAGVEQGVSAWILQLDPKVWNEIYALLPEQTQAFWQGTDVLTMIEEYALAERLPMADSVLETMGETVIAQLKLELPLLLSLTGIGLLSAFAGVFGKTDGVGTTGGFVCRCFALTTVLASLSVRTQLCLTGMSTLTEFMELALPALFTILTAMGSAATVGVFQPATALLCGSITACMRTAVLPVAVAAGVLGMVDCLCDSDRLGGIAAMLKKTLKWVIGAVTTVYIGVMTLSGMGASGFDGLSIRTAKYAASSMVPVVGSMVSGSFDTVLGCAVLVKNAVGIAAIVLSLGIVAVPLIRTVSLMFLLRLAAALMGPVAEKRLVGIYDTAADALQYVIAGLIAVSLMFTITVGLLMTLTNYMTGGV